MSGGNVAVADVIRVVDLIAGVIVLAVSLRFAVDKAYRSRGQMYRFLGLGALSFAISFGSYHALGHSPYWPVLIGNLIGVTLSLLGTVPLMRQRAP